MRSWLIVVAAAALLTCGACGGHSPIPEYPNWSAFVMDDPGEVASREAPTAGARRLRSQQFVPTVCGGFDLTPDTKTLDEGSLVRFLEQRGYSVRTERKIVEPNAPPLTFVYVKGIPGTADAIPLRVAVLPTADGAGRALHDALLNREEGSWGLHRGNVGVLGPKGAMGDDIAFVAQSKLACWGTVTLNDGAGAFVVRGAYLEP
ncbi:MAG TPA: hypothetical protein VKU41_27885 [Polyangiaceae bacterium]|nr:hypothetical protein [Polyangiaceae bacterium]